MRPQATSVLCLKLLMYEALAALLCFTVLYFTVLYCTVLEPAGAQGRPVIRDCRAFGQ
jgi:hypothetical protein